MAEHTPWPLGISPKDRTLIDAIDPEAPGDLYRIASCHSGPFAPAREIAVANARRFVAAWRAVRGIATEDIGLIDGLIREAGIVAGYCRACGGTAKSPRGSCHVCGVLRDILARLECKANG